MIDFVGKKKLFFMISMAIMVVGVIFYFIHGGLNMDIQFKGGTIIQIEMPDDSFDANTIGNDLGSDLGKIVSAQKLKTYNPEIEDMSLNILMLKVPSEHTLTDEEIQGIVGYLRREYDVKEDAQIQMQSVQPFIAEETRQKGLLAISVASVGIVLYIWIRFTTISGLSAGLTALLALFHDIAIMVSAYIIFNIPINESFIAAVLTILGYSINDTIVVYDRIRENTSKMRRLPVEELVNKSINDTLTRTINTSLTTLLAILTVYVFASASNIQSIKEFTFPLLIGIVSGTYSSICIASPLWMMWKKRQSGAKTVRTRRA